VAEDCSRTASERVESGLRTLCSRRWSSLRLTLLAALPEPLLEYRVAYTSALVDLGPQNAVADILIDAHGDGLNTLQQLLTCPIGSLDMRCANQAARRYARKPPTAISSGRICRGTDNAFDAQ
jgi:hypothetical protein